VWWGANDETALHKVRFIINKGGDSWQRLISQNLISEVDRYNYKEKNK